MEAARHDRVVSNQRDGDRLSLVQWVVLDGSLEVEVRGLHAGDLAPVNAQEDALLGVAGREGRLSGRDLDPGGVARHGEAEVCRPAHIDVDVAVADNVVGVESDRWVGAAVTSRTVVFVISWPGDGLPSGCVQS